MMVMVVLVITMMITLYWADNWFYLETALEGGRVLTTLAGDRSSSRSRSRCWHSWWSGIATCRASTRMTSTSSGDLRSASPPFTSPSSLPPYPSSSYHPPNPNEISGGRLFDQQAPLWPVPWGRGGLSGSLSWDARGEWTAQPAVDLDVTHQSLCITWESPLDFQFWQLHWERSEGGHSQLPPGHWYRVGVIICFSHSPNAMSAFLGYRVGLIYICSPASLSCFQVGRHPLDNGRGSGTCLAQVQHNPIFTWRYLMYVRG